MSSGEAFPYFRDPLHLRRQERCRSPVVVLAAMRSRVNDD
jgi:hypothetical protein